MNSDFLVKFSPTCLLYQDLYVYIVLVFKRIVGHVSASPNGGIVLWPLYWIILLLKVLKKFCAVYFIFETL